MKTTEEIEAVLQAIRREWQVIADNPEDAARIHEVKRHIVQHIEQLKILLQV